VAVDDGRRLSLAHDLRPIVETDQAVPHALDVGVDVAQPMARVSAQVGLHEQPGEQRRIVSRDAR
jgi:hypothetical protein